MYLAFSTYLPEHDTYIDHSFDVPLTAFEAFNIIRNTYNRDMFYGASHELNEDDMKNIYIYHPQTGLRVWGIKSADDLMKFLETC